MLDDGSTDGTADVVRRGGRRRPAGPGADRASRCRRAGWASRTPASSWPGRPTGRRVLVFVDADVVLAPAGGRRDRAAAARGRARPGLPVPAADRRDLAERLVQPLLQWSWLTLLPLRPRRDARPGRRWRRPTGSCWWSTPGRVPAGRRARARSRTEVLEDVALVRAVKRAGGRGGVADGTALADLPDVRELADAARRATRSRCGRRSARPPAPRPWWPRCSACSTSCRRSPPCAARWSGSSATAPAVTGRVVVAGRTGGRSWPDALAHPVSVALLGWLTAALVASGTGAATCAGRAARCRVARR